MNLPPAPQAKPHTPALQLGAQECSPELLTATAKRWCPHVPADTKPPRPLGLAGCTFPLPPSPGPFSPRFSLHKAESRDVSALRKSHLDDVRPLEKDVPAAGHSEGLFYHQHPQDPP